MWNILSICGEYGKATMEIIEGSKVDKQHPLCLQGSNADALGTIVMRIFNEFGWLKGCVRLEWCFAPLRVPKTPPADQLNIDAWRPVVDRRAPNASTVNAHSLPLIKVKIAKRAQDKLFTVFHLRHGFHQMPLRKEDLPMTAMCIPYGTAKYTVMPTGLKNAPFMFQKMMQIVLLQKQKSKSTRAPCSQSLSSFCFSSCMTLLPRRLFGRAASGQ